MNSSSAASSTRPATTVDTNRSASPTWRATSTYPTAAAEEQDAIAEHPPLYRPAVQIELNHLAAAVDQLLAQVQAIATQPPKA